MAFLSAIASLAPLVGGLFGKKKSGGTTYTPKPDPTYTALSSWVNNFLPNFRPGEAYGGQYTAPLTGLENQGLTKLGDFLSSPGYGPTFQAGENQILDTLSGKYMNPNTNPWIQSMIGLSKQNLADQIDDVRAQRGARGTYFTSEGIQEEGRLAERTQNYLNTIIGQALENERSRQYGAAGQAAEFDQYKNQQVPLAQIGASQQFGGLQRVVDQADLEARYQDYQRQRQEMTQPLNVAQGLYGVQNPYAPKSFTSPVTQQNNTFGNIMAIIDQINKSGMGGQLGSMFGNIFGGGGAMKPSSAMSFQP